MKDIVESYGINPSLIFGLERILNELEKREDYYAKIGNTTIHYLGTSEDNIQVFQIQRKIKEDYPMKEKTADEKRTIKQLTRAEINKLDILKLREKYNELYKEYLRLTNKVPCKSLEKLGFKTHKQYEELVFYKNTRQWRQDGELQITFNLGMRNIDIAFTKSQGEPVFLELEEVLAIFSKIKELGWLGE